MRETAVAQWLRCCAKNRKVAGSIPGDVSGFFINIKSFRSHYGPGVDSASNRYEYQEYFLVVKRPVRKADNLPLSCAVVTKSGNLNFLEPSGPVTGLLYLYLNHLMQNKFFPKKNKTYIVNNRFMVYLCFGGFLNSLGVRCLRKLFSCNLANKLTCSTC